MDGTYFCLNTWNPLCYSKTYRLTVCFYCIMKHILIPTDFTDNATNALHYALELARLTKAKCTLLHAYEMPYDFASQMENRIVAIRENAGKKLKKLLQQLHEDSRYSDLQIDYQLEEGAAERVVIDVAEEQGVDLVVIGLSKHSGFETFTGDNTGAEVVDRSQVPVLAIPEKVTFTRPTAIVYAAEYRDEDIENLEGLSEWARLFNAELKVIHISGKKVKDDKLRFRGFERELNDRLSYPYVNHELHTARDVEDGILEAVADKEGIILSMAHYHKSFLKDIFGSSHTKAIALKTKVPLLVYYENED